MQPVTFPLVEKPTASVIVLAWRRSLGLLACLESLVSPAGCRTPFEVIVQLNEPRPELLRLARDDVVGARVNVSRFNLGFGGGCNTAAALARGDYLVFLNDDAAAEPHWLDALVTLADAHPEAGAIGSRVLFPDDRLQEAGSIVWRDGSTAAWGEGAPGCDARFAYVREIDYASACALLVRRSTWECIGGFDEAYYPAYYEDLDLCMKIRALGQRVLYQPAAVVRHARSSSTDGHYRRFLVARNKARFVARWGSAIDDAVHPLDPPTGWSSAFQRAVRRARRYPQRLLLIDDFIPERGGGSGVGRAFEAVSELAAGRFALTVCATSEAMGRQAAARAALQNAGIEVLEEDLERHLRRPEILYDMVLISRPNNFASYASVVRREQPQAVLVYDAESLYHLRLVRQAAFAADESRRAELLAAAAQFRAVEGRLRREADLILCISQAEARVLRATPGDCPVEIVPPLGSTVRWTDRDYAGREGMLFVAGWAGGDDSPNVDGLRWFLADVLPLVVAQAPNARLRVTGAQVPASLLALADEHLSFAGFVDDLQEVYGRARVAIAPIRYGAGVKIKTIEAAQAGVPVVATTVGAEGLELDDACGVIVRDHPVQLARAIVRLLTCQEEWEAARARLWEWNAVLGRSRRGWAAVLQDALLRRPDGVLALRGRNRPD